MLRKAIPTSARHFNRTLITTARLSPRPHLTSTGFAPLTRSIMSNPIAAVKDVANKAADLVEKVSDAPVAGEGAAAEEPVRLK